MEGMTVPRLASMVNKSAYWVREQFRLVHLSSEIRTAIDRGEIKVQNAYTLARVPIKIRDELVSAAKVLPTQEFKKIAAEAKKQFLESVQQGRMRECYCEDFHPVAHLRALKEIRREYETGVDAPTFLAVANCKTFLDAWKTALQWVLHLDRISLKQQELEHSMRDRKKLKELQQRDFKRDEQHEQ